MRASRVLRASAALALVVGSASIGIGHACKSKKDVGTTFTVYLPLYNEKAEIKKEKAEAKREKAEAKK